MADFPQRAQVVVIGGGVSGTSAAYHLNKLGISDVVLLERKELTSGTTWHAAGLITSAGMPTETFEWMTRYTVEMLPKLKEETGQDTGFRRIGHLHLATTPQRVETVTREAIFAAAHGIPCEMVDAKEVQRHWPTIKADDILAAAWVPDEGRANPADVAMAWAKGARLRGTQIIEHTPVTGINVENGRVTGVVTDRGTIECETVVVAAGMWGRQLGEMAGVSLPLQAAEHYYLLTDEVEWADPDGPVVEDPDRYGYYREETGGMLVGLFEPEAAPFSLDQIDPELGFAVLPPDWERCGPYLADALERWPGLEEAGIKQFFCGPESFTSDNGPLIGEVPEVRGFYAACGLNSLGILLSGGTGSLVAQWIVDDEPPMDVSGIAPDRLMPFMKNRSYRAERTVELLGDLFGDTGFPTWQPRYARNVRRSVIHDRLADAGADFMVLTGWEVPEWFADPGVSHERPQGWGRDQAFDAVRNEHTAVREAVGVMDMTFMASLLVQGPNAMDVLQRVSAANVDVPVGRIVYTHWCLPGGGIWTDLTVTRLADDRFQVVGADIIHRRMIAWLERHTRADEFVTVTDMTTSRTLLTVQGPRSRDLLSQLTTADLSNDAFPYMTAQQIDAYHGEALAVRVTYLGELGWELHIPNDFAFTVYDKLVELGTGFGLRHAGIGALNSLRLEKAYRDYGLDIDNSYTLIDAGLDWTIDWSKDFVGKDALDKQRQSGVRTTRMIQVLVGDPEPLLYGHEQLYRDGVRVGEVDNGAYGHTLGGGVGLATLEAEADITDDFINSGSWELDVVGTRYPATVSLQAMYDPKRERIKA